VSVLDLLVVLVRHRALIATAILVAVLLGVGYALTAAPAYTAQARLTLEASGEASRLSGGFSALRGLGLNLGSAGGSGLLPEAYPDLFTSREVVLAVARDTFHFEELDGPATFVAYVNREPGPLEKVSNFIKRNTIGLLSRLVSDDRPRRPPPGQAGEGGVRYPTEDEERAIKALRGMVRASYDIESGLLRLAVEASDPVLAARLVDCLLDRLTERVRTIRTSKARQNLAFVRERFQEAERELRAAEERLAVFTDRNRNPELAQLRVEQDRLERRVRFKRDLYSEMQAQVTQAEIELQRSEPVVTVIEAPAPPLNRSAPRRKLIVMIAFLMGAALGVGLAFVRAFVETQEKYDEARAKMSEVRQALAPVLRRASALRRHARRLSPWSPSAGQDDEEGHREDEHGSEEPSDAAADEPSRDDDPGPTTTTPARADGPRRPPAPPRSS
jgi:uncharacterized protein involved in exopolysaccharide biosynthesis